MSNVLMKIPIVNGIFHGVTQVMGPFAPLFKAGLSAAIGFTLESEKVKKALFGEGSVIAKVIYVLVGISALFAITTVVKLAKKTDQ